MKKIILFVLCFASSQMYSQNVGFGLGYSSSSAYFGDVFFVNNKSSFHFGYTSESNNATGKEVSSQKWNYGKTVTGNGKYFSSFDFGYGYQLYNNIRLILEFSFATKKEYTNYKDGRFKGGGYHMLTKDDTEIGIGGFLGFAIENIELFAGYNTVRELGFGFHYLFRK